jgi:hypothetical protein
MCVDSGNGSEGAVEEGQTSRCRIVAGLDGLGTRSWWLLDRPSTSKLKKVGREQVRCQSDLSAGYNQMRIALSILKSASEGSGATIQSSAQTRPQKNAWEVGISRKTLDVGPVGGIMESWEA